MQEINDLEQSGTPFLEGKGNREFNDTESAVKQVEAVTRDQGDHW